MDSAARENLLLVPYAHDSREIVLRHRGHVVVRDQKSLQLSLRQCPTCRRPWREDIGPNNEPMSPSLDSSFHNPTYFRMLRHSGPASEASTRPPSPQGHFLPSVSGVNTPAGNSGRHVMLEEELDDNSSSRAQRISGEAFSPGYFSQFFRVEQKLGKGGKGVVYLVRHSLDGVDIAPFACKIVPVGDDHGWLRKVLVEVKNLQGLAHRNLVSYNHVWLEDFKFATFSPTVPCAFILQQYCNGGDLQQHVLGGMNRPVTSEMLKDRLRSRSKSQLDPPSGLRKMGLDEITSFFTDITEGLNHLHHKGFVHRDLKPSNCLLHTDESGTRVLVSDFGEMQIEGTVRKSTGNTGTISYCAPELLQLDTPAGEFGNFTHKSDIFSLGMILHFMCFRRLPYVHADGINEADEDLEQLRAEISAWKGLEIERRGRDDLPEQLFKNLRRLLSVNSKERPSADEILQNIKPQAPSTTQSYQGPNASVKQSEDSPTGTGHSSSPTSSINARRPSSTAARTTGFASGSRSPPSMSRELSRRSQTDAAFDDTDSSAMIRTRSGGTPIDPSKHEPSYPRLLPPPSRSSLQTILQNTTSNTLPMLLQTALFMFKLWSMLVTCSPFLANASVAYPLVVLAVLDLRGSHLVPGGTIALTLLHLGVLVLALRYDVICPNMERFLDHGGL